MPSQLAPSDLAAWMRKPDAPLLLDVREPEEHQFVALAGSLLIPLAELPARSEELDEWRRRDVVVYCHHGIRSLRAIAHLAALGFEKLHNLSGGIDRWTSDVDSSLPRY
ncbi:MAG: hypothetical protein HYR88_15795 [Verrucomicrobia bacterium]|nr:hypothetical protein [Verrucomicrobiota bacterium]MBI3871101.1 hypothetical protein [Verrucomicrobiota bacterium]